MHTLVIKLELRRQRRYRLNVSLDKSNEKMFCSKGYCAKLILPYYWLIDKILGRTELAFILATAAVLEDMLLLHGPYRQKKPSYGLKKTDTK